MHTEIRFYFAEIVLFKAIIKSQKPNLQKMT